MCNPIAIATTFVGASLLNSIKQRKVAESNMSNIAEFNEYQQKVLDLKKEQTEAQAKYEIFQKVRETIRDLSRNKLANIEAGTYGNIFGRTEYDVRMQSDLDKAVIQTNLENNIDQINREKYGTFIENKNQISQIRNSVPTGLLAFFQLGTTAIHGYSLGKSISSSSSSASDMSNRTGGGRLDNKAGGR